MPPTAQLSYAIAAMNTQFTNTLTSEQPVSNTEDGQESNTIPTPRHRTQIFGGEFVLHIYYQKFITPNSIVTKLLVL